MRLPLAVLLALTLAACVAGPVGNTAVPEPAKTVELPRYLGLWYEFARYENSFEKGCEGVTAVYGLKPNGHISVKNTCREGGVDGPEKSSEGKAVPARDPKNAKLKVSFFGPALMTNYWILDRGDDYGWAIVGDGSGRFLWILTREPIPTPARRAELIDRVKALGYDTTMLHFTKQRAAQ